MEKFVLTVLNFDGTVDERRGYNGHEYGGIATVQRVRGV